MEETTPPARGSGRPVVGLAIVVVGVVLLLDALGVDVPWVVVLPSAVVLVGLVLLLNPRSESSGGWITVGVILTAALLVSSLVDQSVGPAEFAEQEDFVVTEPVERVIVTVDSGRVEVAAGSSAIVEVERQLSFGEERPRVGHTINDGVLLLEADCPGGFFSIGSRCSVDHIVRVPASVEVEIETGAGSVLVSGLDGTVRADTGSGVVELVDLSGRVQADSGSGGVVLEGLSGTVDVATGSGSIRGSDLTTSRLAAGTGSGSINLAFTSAPVDLELETGSGTVAVSVPSGSYRLDLDTSSGSTSFSGITDDAASSRSIRVSTGSGSIRVDGE